jgi:hypothetical protein
MMVGHWIAPRSATAPGDNLKKTVIGICLFVFSTLATTAVRADTFSFTLVPLIKGTFTASGTFTAIEEGSTDVYDIGAVTGTIVDQENGTLSITGLVGLNGFDGNDNKLYFPAATSPNGFSFDRQGVSFLLSDTRDLNLAESSSNILVGSFSVLSPIGFELESITVAVTDESTPPAVPEPGSLILLGSGALCAVGAIRRRVMA